MGNGEFENQYSPIFPTMGNIGDQPYFCVYVSIVSEKWKAKRINLRKKSDGKSGKHEKLLYRFESFVEVFWGEQARIGQKSFRKRGAWKQDLLANNLSNGKKERKKRIEISDSLELFHQKKCQQNLLSESKNRSFFQTNKFYVPRVLTSRARWR